MALFYKTVCILVAGPIGSGKSLFSDLLNSELNNRGLRSEKFCFAGRVKEIATLMGWDGKKDERGRELLQKIGTDVGRHYNQDMWVSYLLDKKIPSHPRFPFDCIIVDDWRFSNEREYIESNPLYDVFSIKMERPGFERDNQHISEHSLPENPAYYSLSLRNSGDVLTLKTTANALADTIISLYNKGDK